MEFTLSYHPQMLDARDEATVLISFKGRSEIKEN
jgi:hypothetical protein